MPVAAAEFVSAVKGIAWPAIPRPEDAAIMALVAQLDHSQRWPREKLATMQLAQADILLKFAAATVPHYEQSLRGRYDPHRPLSWERFWRLPLLTRKDIQSDLDALQSRKLPTDHGPVKIVRTSGSTGTPIAVLETGLMRALFSAMHLRSFVWQGMDFSAAAASIRVLHGEETRETAPGWIAGIVTGPSYTIDVRTTLEEQLQWLECHRPAYLMTLPSNLRACMRVLGGDGSRIDFIQQIHTYGEIVDDALREQCRATFGLAVADIYSANELGVMAVQAPGSDAYYTADESHIVEVLDDDDRPCRPGTVGRIVVTSLHNFASPLIRYANGDYAEVGEPLEDGRGLSVLKRVIGRTRNMAVRPDGERFWPAYGGPAITRIAPLQQVQLIQHTPESIELRAVVNEPITTEQEAKLTEFLQERLRYPYAIRFSWVDHIERGSGQKYEEFVCRVPDTFPGDAG